MVIQLPKQDGLKVIASTGSDEKMKFMREIGADVAFNYKSTDTRGCWSARGPLTWYNTGYQGIKYAEEFYATIPRALAAGELKYSEAVKYGLDKVGEVLLAVQTGANTGKAVVVVAEE
ncbi:hypothetical protein K438DRAFT_1754028 [Mycena galopus ATCC 62051]|nr:hypothetical protein K438DRAFT_1754028 [Mycena galopus ATCC 62051]